MADPRGTFVEGFGLRMHESGMPRMAGRVFATLLLAPADGYTAREIADSLRVSAAAVSGASSYLARTGLAERHRVPGERVDRWRVDGTQWARATLAEQQTIVDLNAWLARALEVVDDQAARARIEMTRDFFAFLDRELPLLFQRWQDSRRDT